jgi:hypothetical protein
VAVLVADHGADDAGRRVRRAPAFHDDATTASRVRDADDPFSSRLRPSSLVAELAPNSCVTFLSAMGNSQKKRVASLPSTLQGKWELGESLGEGGQGNVHLLHSLRGEPDAVIKFLNRDNEYNRERLRREVAALATIKHPNILQILAHEMDPVPFYIAPKGEPFEEYWSRIRDSCEPQKLFNHSVRVIEQLAGGLAAVHAVKLVHRDIKPENVIVFDGDKPVLVDFGIVHLPEAARITKVPAGNRFARDLGSMYDPMLAPPAGDCLCLANLWAWMLALEPKLKHGNYHWRFHQFVDDERCEVARTVLALCSEPTACPQDGTAFLELLRHRFSLSELTMPASDDTAPKRAYLLAVAERDKAKVAMKSEIEVLSEAIVSQLQLLVVALRESGRNLTAKSLPAHLFVTGLADPLSPTNILDAVLSSEQRHLPHTLARLTCGDDNVMDFGVALNIEWHKYPHQDRSKFSLHVHYFHEAAPEIDKLHSHSYKVLPSSVVEHLDAVAVATTIREFFHDENMWTVRTRPRPSGRGAFLD